MRYANKNIAVLGCGESGEAAAVAALDQNAMVTILDSREEADLIDQIKRLRARGARVVTGRAAETDTGAYDFAVLSPGIDPTVPLVQNFVRNRIEIIGELEFAAEICKCPYVAITGTNGKTTTTQLVAAMLKGCGLRTVAAGNISPAFSAVISQSGELDLVTLEVSSFQLEEIRDFRPKVSVWLNFAPDHLDRYATVEEYYQAKLRIFENQTEEDFAVVKLGENLPTLKPSVITFHASQPGADFEFRDGAILYHGESVLRMDQTRLRGLHNAENLMAALGVGVALGQSMDKMCGPLCDYVAMPHRCEIVAEANGVEYVNDSKATNLDALEKALMGEGRPVVLIAGGKDKGFEFDSITELVASKARAVVLIGEMTDRIQHSWSPTVKCVAAKSLADAVTMARDLASPGDVVLFSPGTSSFDMFRNYADRGNQFRDAVNKMVKS